MKIGIQTWGSRGDINPWIALGQALSYAGHEVKILYTSYFGEVDLSKYCNENLMISSTSAFSNKERFRRLIQPKRIFEMDEVELSTYMSEVVYKPYEDEIIASADWLCQTSELIISNPLIYQLNIIANKYKIPYIVLLVDNAFVPSNTASKQSEISKILLSKVNTLLTNFDQPPKTSLDDNVFTSPILNLLMYSKVFGSVRDYWPSNYKICGYLGLNHGELYTQPTDLVDFFENGEPPIFISMGSMAFFEGEDFEVLDIFLDAIKLSGCRAVIQANWDKLKCKKVTDPHIYLIDYIPHELVVPRCIGFVHHGGAGTSHTSLLLGSPSIVIAYAWDQFYWGHELLKLGVCTGVIKRKYLDALQLSGEIRKLMVDVEFKNNAENVRRRIKREKGLDVAIKLIENYIESIRS